MGRFRRRVTALAATGAVLGVALLAGLNALGAGPARAAGPAQVVERSYVYRSSGGRAWSLLAFLPRHRGEVPGVLVVHGGGWNGGSPAGFQAAAAALARSGLAAFDIGYSLARPGQPGFPVQEDDLVSAVEWIRRHGPGLGVDPSRLGALGSSAGGNLVALLALDPRAGTDRRSPLTAVVTWSAPLQLAATAAPPWLRRDLTSYLGCPAAACPGRWRAASPADLPVTTGTAWLMFNSRSEVIPLAGAETMLTHLHRHRVDAGLVVYPGQRHAGQYQGRALAPTISFLRRQLGRAPSPTGGRTRRVKV